MYGVAKIEFSGDSGVSDEVKSSDPLYLFELIFTDELCGSIAEIANLYVDHIIAKNKGNLSSRVKRWKVTSSAMKLFLGFILYEGMIWKPTYERYLTTTGFRGRGCCKPPSILLYITSRYAYMKHLFC